MPLRPRKRRNKDLSAFFPLPNPPAPKANPDEAIALWQASRTPSSPPGSRRPFNLKNALLAWQIFHVSLPQLLPICWGDGMRDALTMSALHVVRGLMPASRAFSQACILDEVQLLLVTQNGSWLHLGRLVATELARVLFEHGFEFLTSEKESRIRQDVKLRIESLQLQMRLRLDMPSLSDPEVRDLLHESDLFVRSFSGGLGPLSPLDFLSVFTTFADFAAQLWLLWTIADFGLASSTPWILFISLLPTLLGVTTSWLGALQPWPQSPAGSHDAAYSEQSERMRTLAFSEAYRQEVLFFGLGPWILQSWKSARKELLRVQTITAAASCASMARTFVHSGSSEVISLIQHVALAPQLSGVTLGVFTVWRSAISSLIQSVSHLSRSCELFYQSIFLMQAFIAAMTVRPKLEPRPDNVVPYRTAMSADGNRGMRIEARNLSFRYPEKTQPALRNVNIVIEPGETIAVVGYNGKLLACSGKTTFASLLLRLFDFDEGELLLNGVDIRRYSAAELHTHSTALFQNFARFSNSTLRENTGFGRVELLDSTADIANALDRAGAAKIVETCPEGIDTKLDFSAFDLTQSSGSSSPGFQGRRALSGGEWQRVAIARALMRASTSDLLLLDEASSALDARAQRELFERIDAVSRTSDGRRRMTVIYITHRLSTVRHAHKVAMFEDGTITDFGTHEELMSRSNSSYKALFDAFTS
ncbi:P-loop containing nucleoside triphosphate hydrolase protein [Exidia glandulosa HHB12029]|uniref:p-loop containing nucleoside triphosphate hydrolase protein n=1 Tax=Exidia glandulosa HHB12029 TaxID=1314781 RepID=A0A165QNI5_EXIGL|nr:P-loop containing nucleoside triphosphate hydrolase protein [Exidia glandulosa HHB12029]